MNRELFNTFCKGAFFLLPLFYWFFFGLSGFGDTDHGYIFSLSWKIWYGQIPYVDFYYVRPPLTPLLHSLSIAGLPDAWEIPAERFLYYLMMSASVYWLTRATWLNLRGLQKTPFWAIALLCWIITIHNFPANAWHSVDAVFFAALGCFLILRYSKPFPVVAGLIAFLFAALAKQPFILLIPAGLTYVFLRYDLKRFVIGLGGLVLITGIIWIGGRIWHAGFWPAFAGQVLSAGDPGEIVEAGILSYFKPLLLVLPFLIFRIILERKKYSLKWAAYAEILLVLCLLMVNAVLALYRNEYQPPLLGYGKVIWMLGLIAAGWMWFNNEKFWLGMALMLLTGWLAGISWGYQTPLLAVAPAVAGWIRLLKIDDLQSGITAALLPVTLILFITMNLFIYGSGPLWELQFRDEVPAKMSNIRLSDSQAEQLRLIETYSENYHNSWTVLPAMPAAEYLTNSVNWFPVTWAHNAEIHWPGDSSQIIQSLNEQIKVVFIQKSRLYEAEVSGRYGSGLTARVMDQWDRFGEDEYFIHYRQPGAEW